MFVFFTSEAIGVEENIGTAKSIMIYIDIGGVNRSKKKKKKTASTPLPSTVAKLKKVSR
jgi:hypothetical protein